VKVLIAEDDPVSRRLLEAFLRKWGYEVQVVCDGGEAWEALQGPEAPSLVISDWMMPDMDGLDLCRRIREKERTGYTYFIILTAKGRKEDSIEGLKAGADDFLIKPFDHEELKYRVRIGERIIQLEQKIMQMASTDFLTGVLNRRAFMERMEVEINRSGREKTSLSLIMADIDHFKKINDAYGHQVGDVVLQNFAQQIRKSSRPYDFVGRYGGEEFVACLPGANASQTGAAAERMRKGVEEMRSMTQHLSEAVVITGSFGVSCLKEGSQEDMDSLIRQADEALYRAKLGGRNRVCIRGEA
jgi:two-component system cell cycle response regulator